MRTKGNMSSLRECGLFLKGEMGMCFKNKISFIALGSPTNGRSILSFSDYRNVSYVSKAPHVSAPSTTRQN